MTRAFVTRGERLLAIAFVGMITLALAGIMTADTAASFTSTSVSPGNQFAALLVQPPGSQNPITSGAAGAVT
ncbi:MAG TPA: hypothetical protein VM052_03705, partial [Candidatus Limnocylindrales bacterium]|nr:hypothetical protein [Candidatus Limnocylindrales bacterium]